MAGESLNADILDLTAEQINALAEIFLMLENWQNELDLKEQKENAFACSAQEACPTSQPGNTITAG